MSMIRGLEVRIVHIEKFSGFLFLFFFPSYVGELFWFTERMVLDVLIVHITFTLFFPSSYQAASFFTVDVATFSINLVKF